MRVPSRSVANSDDGSLIRLIHRLKRRFGFREIVFA
jgi:hypothetical protein